MNIRWLGAILIVVSCAGIGFSMVASHIAQERAVRDLLRVLEFMESDLKYRLTPLPELCESAGERAGGQIGTVFKKVAQLLNQRKSAEVSSCMAYAITVFRLNGAAGNHMLTLGETLGRFDLEGQLRGIAAVKSDCQRSLEELSNNRESRLRSYQTLGLCAGAALAILLI